MRSAVPARVAEGRASSARSSANLPPTSATNSASHQRELRRDQAQVEQHADRDEEQPEQHVAERLDVLLDLVAVLGLGDQHAGEEGAQRQRQAGELGEERQRARVTSSTFSTNSSFERSRATTREPARA